MKDHTKALVASGLCLLLGVGGWVFLSRKDAPSEIERTVTRLPELTLQTIDGQEVRTAAWQGQVVIVNFWASWCAPCIEEVPSLIRLSQAMAGEIKILAVSGDSTLDDVHVFLKSFPDFKRPGISIAFDEKLKLARRFNVNKLPESYIFNAEGTMVRKVSGSIDWSTADAVEYLKSLRR